MPSEQDKASETTKPKAQFPLRRLFIVIFILAALMAAVRATPSDFRFLALIVAILLVGTMIDWLTTGRPFEDPDSDSD